MSSHDGSGTLSVLGMGPGDPELLTVKAARILAASRTVAFFHKRGRTGHARSIAAAHVAPDTAELAFEYPFTTEIAVADPAYGDGIARFYDACADRIAARLGDGHDVALLCEGDPFFFGSAMYLFDRLHRRFRCAVIPGITAMSGCWSAVALPFTHGDDVLSVLPGTLPEDTLLSRLSVCDAAVIMKVGRNLPKIRRALERAGKADRAMYVERGTQPEQRILPLGAHDGAPAPYFALVLVPGRQGAR